MSPSERKSGLLQDRQGKQDSPIVQILKQENLTVQIKLRKTGIVIEMLVCEDLTSCTDLACCHPATILHSNGYYNSCSKYFLGF